VIRPQNVEGQAAAARAQAATARADAAVAAREAAAAAREQMRAQAQMLRDQAQMARDVERMQHQLPVISIPGSHGPSPRQEKMMFAGFLIVVMAAVVIFYPLVRAFARRLEGAGRTGGALDTGSAERLQRIEQAVDAMAIEIERISEGQRFTTKLLAARADAPIVPLEP
jgi:hypothetical protein